MATWSKAPSTPFGAVPERIPLDPDPLASVVAQVRFALVLSVRDQGFVAPFQEAIRQVYPLTRGTLQQRVTLGVENAPTIGENVLWRFSDAEENWQVTLSEDFVSLSCSDYSDRDDFLGRLRQVFDAVADHVRPGLATRVGVRYTDRLSDPDKLAQLGDFFRPELLGMANTDLGSCRPEGELTRADFSTDLAKLHGVWGHLPPGSTHDQWLEPIDVAAWILDLDAYSETTAQFDARSCAQEAERHVDTVYRFFRWAVSDEFLRAHGATL